MTPTPIQCPKTWLTESILTTIFCCLPFGIVAIVNASKVGSLYAQGDYEGALDASKKAQKWTKISFFVAIGWTVLSLLCFIIGDFLTSL